MDNNKYEVITLSSKEIRILYYQSPFFDSFKYFKYFDLNALDDQFSKEDKEFNNKFVCIFKKENSEEEIKKGNEKLKSKLYHYRNQLEQEKKYGNSKIDEKKMKLLMNKRMIGIMKISYRDGRESMMRGFASLLPEYIGKGLSEEFNIEYERLAREFLSTTTYETPYIDISDDYSANAMFSTEKRIMEINKKLEEEFPKYKEQRMKYRMKPYDGFDKRLEEIEKKKEYFNDIPFFGNETHFEFFKKSGFKKMKNMGDDKLIINSNNQYSNILSTIKNIKSKTKLKKFLFAFSILSNREYVVDTENSIFNSFNKEKKLKYGLYFIEYDEDNGIQIIKDIETVKKNNKIKSNILEEKLKFQNSYTNTWYNYNEKNIVSNIDLMFVRLKDNYLRWHHSQDGKKKGITIEELTEKKNKWEDKQKEIKQKEMLYNKKAKEEKKKRNLEKQQNLEKSEKAENFFGFEYR